MLTTYEYPQYEGYSPTAEERAGTADRIQVAIIGGGPVGLSAALEMAHRGHDVVLLDEDHTVSIGSRAVCYAKRPLEIWDRLGCADAMTNKGISWQVGKVFLQDDLIYQFDLLPEHGHKMPAMINLQQYYLEEYLVERCKQFKNLQLRYGNKVTGVQPEADHVVLSVNGEDQDYQLSADWVIACDGAKSFTRRELGLDFMGQVFHDHFLIADVVMKTDFPTERWFWFDPPFHPGKSVLLHKQADNVWRIDFQLGWDTDTEAERQPERVIPRLKAMLGEDTPFDLEWVSVYTFQCRRLEKFRHGRILFAGDSAHQVSPFGARGANSGVADTDNLGWKLDLVLKGQAPDSLLDSYSQERTQAADDNIKNSTRSTEFITPKSRNSEIFQAAVLDLARKHTFARPIVNSGRLSTPTWYDGSSLNTEDTAEWHGLMRPGAPCADAPIRDENGEETWLLNKLGWDFVLLYMADEDGNVHADTEVAMEELAKQDVPVKLVAINRDIRDQKGLIAARYDMIPGACYLIRPDQTIAARWTSFDKAQVMAARDRAIGKTQ